MIPAVMPIASSTVIAPASSSRVAGSRERISSATSVFFLPSRFPARFLSLEKMHSLRLRGLLNRLRSGRWGESPLRFAARLMRLVYG